MPVRIKRLQNACVPVSVGMYEKFSSEHYQGSHEMG